MEKYRKTERLYIQNLSTDDVDVIFNYRNDVRCNKFQRWTAFSREDINEFVQAHKDDVYLSAKEEQHYALHCISADQTIGELGYFYNAGDCVTLGITVAEEFQRQGYACEILKAVIADVRAKYPELDIVALIDKDNIKSINLFEKIGFEQDCYAESISSFVYLIRGITAFTPTDANEK